MSTSHAQSWSQPADPRPGPRASSRLPLAVAVLRRRWARCSTSASTGTPDRRHAVYQRYGDAMANGQVPYRDFELEYPPGALPVFALPSLLRSHDGDLTATATGSRRDGALRGARARSSMLALLLAASAAPRHVARRSRFAALAPLAARLGRALALRPLAGGAHGRGRSPRSSPDGSGSAAGVLGLAVAAKIYPAVLVPLALVCVWRRRGRREALVCLGVFAAVRRARLPAVRRARAARGLAQPRPTQTSRPLQIETLGAAVLLVAHQVGGLGIDDALEPRLAEPRRRRPGRARGRPDGPPGRGARRRLGLVRARRRPTRERLVRARRPRSARSSPSARCSRRSS